MNQQNVTIPAIDGESFSAYVAYPDVESAPGLIVIQEIFGINDVMRELVDTYAKAGYVAIAPDLFWRQKPGIQISENEMEQAFELFGNFSVDKGIEDLIATLNVLKTLPGCNGKVGSVGYCLGGKLAYLMATRSEADCNVSYYGVSIEENLDEAINIQHPLILHLAELDEFATAESLNQIKTELGNNSKVTIYSYSGVNHAFARPHGQPYVEEAANLANSRTLDFFKQYLG